MTKLVITKQQKDKMMAASSAYHNLSEEAADVTFKKLLPSFGLPLWHLFVHHQSKQQVLVVCERQKGEALEYESTIDLFEDFKDVNYLNANNAMFDDMFYRYVRGDNKLVVGMSLNAPAPKAIRNYKDKGAVVTGMDPMNLSDEQLAVIGSMM